MLQGKKGLILGIANRRSIAWGIAKKAAEAGAELALTYAGERLKGNVEELGKKIGARLFLPCDVTRDEDISALFETLGEEFGHLDFLVHAIAFAKKDELAGDFVQTSREGFQVAQDVSAYSLTALARGALPLMEGRQGSILTLTYLGGQRVVQNYNVMGVAKAALEAAVRYLAADLGKDNVRVNALSAGPVNTLSARGIRGFTSMLHAAAERSPLGRNITLEEIGGTAVYLASDYSTAVTGETLHVDAGYHVMGT